LANPKNVLKVTGFEGFEHHRVQFWSQICVRKIISRQIEIVEFGCPRL
jgi:hypothetical protein